MIQLFVQHPSQNNQITIPSSEVIYTDEARGAQASKRPKKEALAQDEATYKAARRQEFNSK